MLKISTWITLNSHNTNGGSQWDVQTHWHIWMMIECVICRLNGKRERDDEWLIYIYIFAVAAIAAAFVLTVLVLCVPLCNMCSSFNKHFFNFFFLIVALIQMVFDAEKRLRLLTFFSAAVAATVAPLNVQKPNLFSYYLPIIIKWTWFGVVEEGERERESKRAIKRIKEMRKLIEQKRKIHHKKCIPFLIVCSSCNRKIHWNEIVGNFYWLTKIKHCNRMWFFLAFFILLFFIMMFMKY